MGPQRLDKQAETKMVEIKLKFQKKKKPKTLM